MSIEHKQSEIFYVVWNADKTQGFATTDYHLAHAAREDSNDNCYDENGVLSELALTFLLEHGDEDCAIEAFQSSPVCIGRYDLRIELGTQEPRFPRSLWIEEVQKGDTLLGYWEWVVKQEGAVHA